MKEPKYQKAKDLLKVDNMKDHPMYMLWRGMVNRCEREKDVSYQYYGGKGVKVCERWTEPYGMGLFNFFLDMGERPSKSHSIDRLDPMGNYCSENCKWIETSKQSKNKGKYKNNNSGHTGVRLLPYENKPKWGAFWRDLKGKERKKTFSIKKYGYNKAFQLAKNYREFMIKELNKQGAGYSEHHGK